MSSTNDPYLILHLIPEKTGDKAERIVASASEIKKFNYEDYQKNKSTYKNKNFRVKVNDSNVKRKCNVLYASDCYDDIENNFNNRFPIPVHTESFSSESSKELNQENADLGKVKRSRKENIKLKKAVAHKTEEDIIHGYLNESQTSNLNSLNNLDNNDDDNMPLPKIASTPKKNKVIVKSVEIFKDGQPMNENKSNGFNLYDNLYGFKRTDAGSQEHLLTNSLTNNHPSIPPPLRAIDFCADKDMYAYDENVHEKEDIGNGVLCNRKAYYDAFKAKTPTKCFNILHQGVYGIQDLSTRCVRKQKNTLHLKELSPEKSLAIENQLYRFMRLKEVPKKDVEYFFNNLNTAYHSVITSAKSRVKTLQKLEEEEALINKELAHDPLA